MASLTGKAPSATYKDLLQVSNSNSGIDATLRDLEDGEGTVGPVKFSTTGMRLQATATLDGASGATLDMTNIAGTRMKSWTLLDSSAPSSGSTHDVSGIPSTAVAVMIVMSDMDYSTNTRIDVEVADDGSFQTSGYDNISIYHNNSTGVSASPNNSDLRFSRINNSDGTNKAFGLATLFKNAATGRWYWDAVSTLADDSFSSNYYVTRVAGMTPVISGTLDELRFSTLSGTFSSGTISVYYQE